MHCLPDAIMTDVMNLMAQLYLDAVGERDMSVVAGIFDPLFTEEAVDVARDLAEVVKGIAGNDWTVRAVDPASLIAPELGDAPVFHLAFCASSTPAGLLTEITPDMKVYTLVRVMTSIQVLHYI